MTINVISDLHCRRRTHEDHVTWYGFDVSKLEPADVLVVAGDLGEYSSYPFVKEELEKLTQFNHVITIRGNHDYWGLPHDKPYPEENEVRVIDNVAFICTPLWTPIPTSEKENPNYLNIMWTVSDCMNDFRYISGWNIDIQNEQYKANLEFIKTSFNEQKAEGRKIVIVTHSVPRKDLVDSRFRGSSLNYAFHVMDGSCNKIKPDLWICGHAHNYVDKIKYGVRHIRNPIGYRWGFNELSDEHWYNTVVEV